MNCEAFPKPILGRGAQVGIQDMVWGMVCCQEAPVPGADMFIGQAAYKESKLFKFNKKIGLVVRMSMSGL